MSQARCRLARPKRLRISRRQTGNCRLRCNKIKRGFSVTDTPITDVFRQLHQKTKERKSIERNAGRTMFSLSQIEELLSFMFGIFYGAKEKEFGKAVKIFAEINGPALKIKLVDLMMHKEASPAELKQWASIHGVLTKHKAVRDLVAHQLLIHTTDEATGLRSVHLGPSYFGSKRRKGQVLDAKMIAATADALAPLETSIYKLAGQIMLRVTAGSGQKG